MCPSSKDREAACSPGPQLAAPQSRVLGQLLFFLLMPELSGGDKTQVVAWGVGNAQGW